MHFRTAFGSLLCVAALTMVVSACDDTEPDPDCETIINIPSITSTSAGTVSGTGQIESGESALLRYTKNGQTSTVTGEQVGDKVVFSGIPAGVLEIEILMSCQGAGQVSYTTKTVTVL
jgi:hypothetical protein